VTCSGDSPKLCILFSKHYVELYVKRERQIRVNGVDCRRDCLKHVGELVTFYGDNININNKSGMYA
jgi:hypothetical protein